MWGRGRIRGHRSLMDKEVHLDSKCSLKCGQVVSGAGGGGASFLISAKRHFIFYNTAICLFAKILHCSPSRGVTKIDKSFASVNYNSGAFNGRIFSSEASVALPKLSCLPSFHLFHRWGATQSFVLKINFKSFSWCVFQGELSPAGAWRGLSPLVSDTHVPCCIELQDKNMSPHSAPWARAMRKDCRLTHRH